MKTDESRLIIRADIYSYQPVDDVWYGWGALWYILLLVCKLQRSRFILMFKNYFNRFYWVCLLVTTTISYGFKLTNFTITIEDTFFEHYFFQGYAIEQGRWGSILFRRVLDSYLFLPFWRNFFALILMITGVTIFSGLFKKYSEDYFDEKVITIFACITISFPIIADTFVFMTATVDFSMLLLFTGISLFFSLKWIIDKRDYWFNGIIGALFLGYATSFYEYAIVLFLILAFSVLLAFFMTSQIKEKKRSYHDLIMFVKIFIIAIAGILICKFAGILIQKVYSLQSDSYSDKFILYDTSSLLSLVQSFSSYILSFPLKYISLEKDIIDWLILCSAVIIICIGVFLSIKRKNASILLSGFFVVISAYSLYFITGNLHLVDRMLVTFSVLVGFCAALLYVAAPAAITVSKKIPTINIRYFVLVIAAWVVFTQSREMNKFFYLDYQRYKRDVFIMESIVHDLGGLERSKPVIFIGFVPETLPMRDTAGFSSLNFRRTKGGWWEVRTERIYPFFEMHGYPINYPEADKLDESTIRAQISDMEDWPASGYIKEFDDYVIVKMGWSTFEQVNTERKQTIAGEITRQLSVLQTFDTKEAEIKAISIYLGTYGRTNNSHLNFEFGYIDTDNTRVPIYDKNIDSSIIKDTKMHYITFEQSMEIKEGRHYVQLTSDDAEFGNAVTVYLTEGKDETESSHLFINDEEIDAEMIFEIH